MRNMLCFKATLPSEIQELDPSLRFSSTSCMDNSAFIYFFYFYFLSRLHDSIFSKLASHPL